MKKILLTLTTIFSLGIGLMFWGSMQMRNDSSIQNHPELLDAYRVPLPGRSVNHPCNFKNDPDNKPDVTIGMSQKEVLDTWGQPGRSNRDSNDNQTWVYVCYRNTVYLFFRDGIFTSFTEYK